MIPRADTETQASSALPSGRAQTRTARVRWAGREVLIGSGAPIVVQSMTTPDTSDVEKVLAEIQRLEEAGCELVRVTVPKPDDAAVLSEIKRRINIPLICIKN